MKAEQRILMVYFDCFVRGLQKLLLETERVKKVINLLIISVKLAKWEGQDLKVPKEYLGEYKKVKGELL